MQQVSGRGGGENVAHSTCSTQVGHCTLPVQHTNVIVLSVRVTATSFDKHRFQTSAITKAGTCIWECMKCYGPGSVLWRRCGTLCTSGFMDDVTFAHNGQCTDRYRCSE